jgi:hypothetical protein
MYLGCEAAGGGWSSAGGTALRYNLKDSASTWASFDFPLHAAGDFDTITNLWVHVVLAVSPTTLKTWDDGQPVDDSLYGFYTGALSFRTRCPAAAGGTCNAAYPYPNSTQLGAFTLSEKIVLGGRADHNAQRHFKGDMAGLMISGEPLTDSQVQCIFTQSEQFLPSQLSACAAASTAAELSVSFMDSSVDSSGHGRTITWNPSAASRHVTAAGATFDADADYVTVQFNDGTTRDSYEHPRLSTGGTCSDAAGCTTAADNGEFSVSFWMSKDACTTQQYEYMYSHMSSTLPGSMWTSSSLNIYLACQANGGGSSTLGTSVVRYSVLDTGGREALIDTPLHAAGNFDAITNTWVHIVLTVTPSSIVSYDDGVRMRDSQYGYFVSNPGDPSATPVNNIAHPTPSSLAGGGFRLSRPNGPVFDFSRKFPQDARAGKLYIGTRSDSMAGRRFRGKLALLNVYSSKLTDVQALCVFRQGDFALPDASAGRACPPRGAPPSANPCQNNGRCRMAVGHFLCRCARGFSGPLCNSTATGWITPSVVAEAASVAGYTTYTLKVTLTPNAYNVYRIYGSAARSLQPLYMPPAYHNVLNGATTRIGGVDPRTISASGDSDAAFDSWLTIGDLRGNQLGIRSAGLQAAFSGWTSNTPLGPIDSPAAYVELPTHVARAPSRTIVVAQLTVQGPRGTRARPGNFCPGGRCPAMSLMGKQDVGQMGNDWQQSVTFRLP